MRRVLVLLLIGSIFIGIALAGGVVNFGMYSDITSLNIWSMLGPNATSWNFYPAIDKYGSLYGLSDVTNQLVPSLADGFWSTFQATTVDGTSAYVTTIHLLKGVKWSDGTPFTANDVVFSYEVPFKLNMPGNWGGDYPPAPYNFIKATKVNDYTVDLYVKQPSGEFIYDTLMAPIVQEKFWEPVYEAALKTPNPAQYMMNYDKNLYEEPSIGPITVSQWQHGAFIKDTAIKDYSFKGEQEIEYANGAIQYIDPALGINATYYGTPEGTILHKFITGPYVDSIIYDIYQNQTAAVAALMKGTIGYLLSPNGLEKGFVQELQTNPNVKIVQNQDLGFDYIAFNMRRYPMNIKAFRVAIAYLIDRHLLADKIIPGSIVPLASLVPPGNKFWYDPNLKYYGEGMDTAQRYEAAIDVLKKAGFSWLIPPKIENGQLVQRGEGLIGPNGKIIKQITMLAPSAGYDPIRATIALWIEKWANDIGIPLYADLTSFNNIVNAVWNENFNFDIYMLGWGISIYPSYLHDFFAQSQNVPGGFNSPGYDNPQFEQLAREFIAQTDMNKAREYAFQLEKILEEDVPYVVIYSSNLMEAYRPDEVQFAYTHTLGGIQNVYGEQAFVKSVDTAQ